MAKKAPDGATMGTLHRALAHLAPENYQLTRRKGGTPLSSCLPVIIIGERGVLIGRGGEAEWAAAADAGLDYAYVGPRESDAKLDTPCPTNQVSARHCRIFASDGEWHLQQEASSKNGVRLNDGPLPIGPSLSVRLEPGDRIHLVKHLTTCGKGASITFIFRLGPPHAPSLDIPIPPAPNRSATERTEDELRCCICLELAGFPVRMEPCGHVCDAGCLEKAFNRLVLCPICRTPPNRVVDAADIRARVEAEFAQHPGLERPPPRPSMLLPGNLDAFAKRKEASEPLRFEDTYYWDYEAYATLFQHARAGRAAEVAAAVAERNGLAALLIASKHGHVQVVSSLLGQEGIDANQADCDGLTPLHWAAGSGRVEVVTALLAHEAIDANKVAGYGQTPLDLAAENGHVEIATALRRFIIGDCELERILRLAELRVSTRTPLRVA